MNNRVDHDPRREMKRRKIWKAPHGGWHAYNREITTVADMRAVQWFSTRQEAREWIKQCEALEEDSRP